MKKIVVEVVSAAEDQTEDWFWVQGALSVSSLPPHEEKRILEGLFNEIDPCAFQTGLEVLLADHMDPIRSLTLQNVDEQAWQVSWRESFKPLEAGGFRLVGEWERPAKMDQRTILIYPGMAFGTGQHETTRLVLDRLNECNLEGVRVCDAGCGSGILSIAAERLGAAEVFGFDADPDCQENMAHHLRINETRRTTLEIGTLDRFQLQPFDVIVANITVNVLQIIWPQLALLLKPNGRLISSGILDSQQTLAVTSLKACGLAIDDIRTSGEWLLIEASRP